MQACVTFLMGWETLLEMKFPAHPLRLVSKGLERPDVDIVNFGLIDTAERAMEAGHQFQREPVDVIFLYVTTYALTRRVRAKCKPRVNPDALLDIRIETVC